MLSKLIKEIENVEVGKYFNPVTEVAKKLSAIKDPVVAGQLVMLLGVLDGKNQEAYAKRQDDDDE